MLPNCCLLIVTCEISLIPLSYLSVLVPVFLDLIVHVGFEILCPVCRKTGITLYFDFRDTLHPKPFCTSKATTRPCVEYCSYIWDGAPQSGCLDLLHRVQKRLVNFIGFVLSSTLQPLSHRRVVASLSLFYKYYHGICSQELSPLVPHGHLSVRFSESLYQYAVDIPRCKRKFYQINFFVHALQLFGILSHYRLLSIRFFFL